LIADTTYIAKQLLGAQGSLAIGEEAQMLEEQAVRDLLLAMPEDGWMRGRGPHQKTLHAMLDEGSSLVAENIMPEEDTPGIQWLVRLTPAGIAHAKALREGRIN
jgi:hypothetical protein